jgi:hypothetical protein
VLDAGFEIVGDGEGRHPPTSSYIRTWAAIQSGRLWVQVAST